MIAALTNNVKIYMHTPYSVSMIKKKNIIKESIWKINQVSFEKKIKNLKL